MAHGGPEQLNFFFEGGSNPEPRLAPGYERNEDGEIVDAKGNVYDEEGNLKSTPASPELEAIAEHVRREHPDWKKNDPAVYKIARARLSFKKSGKPPVEIEDPFLR